MKRIIPILLIALIVLISANVSAETDELTLNAPYSTFETAFVSKSEGSKITVMWSRAYAKYLDGTFKKASGYEVQYATKSDFSNAKTIKKNSDIITINLKNINTKKKLSETKYHVRVRAYKTVGAKTCYSSWRKAGVQKEIKAYEPIRFSLKSDRNIVTTTWNKGDYEGYIVYMKTDSAWAKKKTTDGTSAEFKLAYDTEYSFKVMGYKTVTTSDPRKLNTTTYAILYDRNNTETVIPRYSVPTPTLSAKFINGVLNVDEQDGDTFRIELSENSDFSEEKSITVKKSEFSEGVYPIKDLKPDTTYYVRMQAVSVYNGKTYYSQYSNICEVSYESPKYTVIFDGNGSDNTMSSVQIKQGNSLPKCTLSREGYAFVGWSTESKGIDLDSYVIGTPRYGDGETLIADAGETVTLYACWQGTSPIAAADWALLIASDDSFEYGMVDDDGKVSKSGHSHCPICKGGAKVFNCNALCAAAYQHGMGLFAKYWAGSTDPSKWINRGFTDMGKNLDPKKIKKGDIICCHNDSRWSHIMMAASNDNVALGKKLIVNARGWDKGICTQNMLNKLDNYKYYQVLRME